MATRASSSTTSTVGGGGGAAAVSVIGGSTRPVGERRSRGAQQHRNVILRNRNVLLGRGRGRRTDPWVRLVALGECRLATAAYAVCAPAVRSGCRPSCSA